MKHNTYFSYSPSTGQVLIESLVSITVVTVGLLAVLGLLSRSLAFQRDLGQRLIATYLAAEGIEVVKNIIDTEGISSLGEQNNYYSVDYQSATLKKNHLKKNLFFDTNFGLYRNINKFENANTPFLRMVRVYNTIDGNPGVRVTAIVRWKVRNGDIASTTLEDYFYDWRPTS